MVKWLIETDVFDENAQKLCDIIASQGMEFKKHRYVPFEEPDQFLHLFNKDDCVVFYGSIQFANQVKRHAPWIPGVYLNTPEFECLFYYPRFGDFLLNRDYVMLPFGELHRRKEFLMSTLGEDNCVFIRPSSGLKSFTGKVVTSERWDREIDQFALYEPPPEALVVVARPINLAKEWRLVVVDGKIITASKYRDGGKIERQAGAPETVLNFAQDVCDKVKYSPDPAWILDVCETATGELYILEVGSFSCAGLYSCDLDLVVKSVSAVAHTEWLDLTKGPEA